LVQTPPKKNLEVEFRSYLYSKGIRNIFYIGNYRLASAIYDKLAAQDANLKWYSEEQMNQDVINMLKSGGPWYVYGLSNDEMATLLNADDILRVVKR